MKKLVILFLLSFMLSSCGTILKNERAFKKSSSQIDYDVLALDMLGLPFFILPGVIMLSVDLITGTLYLSPQEAKAFKPKSIQKQVNELIVN